MPLGCSWTCPARRAAARWFEPPPPARTGRLRGRAGGFGRDRARAVRVGGAGAARGGGVQRRDGDLEALLEPLPVLGDLHPGDHLALDLRGALEELEDLRVPEPLLE